MSLLKNLRDRIDQFIRPFDVEAIHKALNDLDNANMAARGWENLCRELVAKDDKLRADIARKNKALLDVAGLLVHMPESLAKEVRGFLRSAA